MLLKLTTMLSVRLCRCELLFSAVVIRYVMFTKQKAKAKTVKISQVNHHSYV